MIESLLVIALVVVVAVGRAKLREAKAWIDYLYKGILFHQAAQATLERRLGELERRLEQQTATPPIAAHAPAQIAAAPAVAAPPRPAYEPLFPAPVVTPPAVSVPEPAVSVPEPAVSVPEPAVSAPEPAVSAPEPAVSAPEPAVSAPEPAVSVPEPAVSAPEPAVSAPEPAVSAPEPAVSAREPAVAPPSAEAPRAFDWESLVGVRLFSWIAAVALAFGAVFFLKYSVEHGWLAPPVRMAIGLAFGAGLLVVCELKGQTVRVTANALAASGIAILFATVFAADTLWHLLPSTATLALMVLVTAVAVLLSLRHDSIFIALLGLVGGFATPVLLSTGQDRPIGLFSYLALLGCGLSAVAYKKRWPLLVSASVALTTIYQWGWVVKFVSDRPEQDLPIAVVIFGGIPVLTAVAQWLGERGEKARPHELFRKSVVASALSPLLFGITMALVPSFGAHSDLMFGFMLIVDAGIVVLAATRGPGSMHLVAGVATLLVFALFFASSYRPEAYPSVLAWVVAFVLLFLLAAPAARRLGRTVSASMERARYVAPLLLLAFPALELLEPRASSPWLAFGVLFALSVVLAIAAITSEKGGLHYLAAFFAVAAEACWSAKHLEVDRLYAGLALYAVFGLFYLGVPIVARHLGRKLDPQGSGVALLLASLAMLFFLAAGEVARGALFGMGMLLVVLNLGLLLEARTTRMSWAMIPGIVLSWIVIGVFWATTMVAALLIPAMVVTAGFALVVVGGNLWAVRRSEAEGQAKGAFQSGLFLGLAGHVFLLFVATRTELSVPPFALFGVLGVLDLAIVAAALLSRRIELHLAAIVMSELVVVTFTVCARGEPGPVPYTLVGLGASLLVAALGIAMLPLARRRAVESPLVVRTAAIGVLLAEGVAVVAGAVAEAPALPWLVGAHALCLVALSSLLARRGEPELLLGGWVFSSLGVFLFGVEHLDAGRSHELIGFALAPYAIFSLYPFTLGRAAAKRRLPFVLAVLASASFFLVARWAIIRGGHEDVIGILPVAEAIVLLANLALVLKLEPPVERDRGRLALVAGAALAFVTAAIPLQLSKQWITIGWALEAAALAWAYLRIAHKGLLGTSLGLAVAVIARLSFNREVLAYHERSATPVWNFYLYTYLVAAAALFLAGYFALKGDQRLHPSLSERLPRPSSVMLAGGTLLLFLLVNIEVADAYSTGGTITFNFSSTLAQDLTYTIAWALFAVGTLTFGILLGSRPPRIAALLLLVATVVKCFLHDLWRLGGLYRVGSFVGLALCLALVAIVLQRFVLAPSARVERS